MMGTEKKTKAPTPFRIEQETADRFREAAKEFSNQDDALNALLAAFVTICNTLHRNILIYFSFLYHNLCITLLCITAIFILF